MLVICVPTITHRPIQFLPPPSLFRSIQHQDTYLEEHWQLDFIQMCPLSGYKQLLASVDTSTSNLKRLRTSVSPL